MEYFEILLNAAISGLLGSIGAYVIYKIAKKDIKNELIEGFFKLADDENTQKLLYKYGFLFAQGAANAIPMLRGAKGGKFKLEDIITSALGSIFSKGLPGITQQAEGQPSNTSAETNPFGV